MPTIIDIGTLIESSPIPEEIAAKIEHITLAQIHAAFAYYHANRDELDNDIAAEDAAAEAIFPAPPTRM